MVTIAFNVVLHVVLLGSLLLFLGTAVKEVVAEPDRGERQLQFMSMFVGAAIAVGANAVGDGYATYIANALAGSRGTSAGAAAVSYVIPSLLGIGVGFAVVAAAKRNNQMAKRIVVLFAVLSTVAFLLVYAQAVSAKGVILGVAAVPNLLFTVGVMLTLVLSLRTGDSGQSSEPGIVAQAAASLWSRFGSGGRTEQRPPAPESGGPRIVRKDDFDTLN